jgi:hypothetical protein
MASTTTAAEAHVTNATMAGDRYRVIDLRAGRPGMAEEWYSQ